MYGYIADIPAAYSAIYIADLPVYTAIYTDNILAIDVVI
jgi:hypothetical protein